MLSSTCCHRLENVFTLLRETFPVSVFIVLNREEEEEEEGGRQKRGKIEKKNLGGWNDDDDDDDVDDGSKPHANVFP